MENGRIDPIRLFYHVAHCVEYVATYDEGKLSIHANFRLITMNIGSSFSVFFLVGCKIVVLWAASSLRKNNAVYQYGFYGTVHSRMLFKNIRIWI